MKCYDEDTGGLLKRGQGEVLRRGCGTMGDYKLVQGAMDSVKKHFRDDVVEGAMEMWKLKDAEETWKDAPLLSARGALEKGD